MEERHITEIIAGRFAILDRMREIGNDNGIVTVSIGVGRGGKTFAECDQMARAALDMALGRGGDQAAVRTPDGNFEFYGGVSRSVEKRTKVKSRIIGKRAVRHHPSERQRPHHGAQDVGSRRHRRRDWGVADL